MHIFSSRFLLVLFLATCSRGQMVIAQQLPASSLASPAPFKAGDVPKWILLRNQQVIQSKIRVAGERIVLIMDNGAELTVPATDIQFQGESIDQIAKFRLAGIDPNNVLSQVEFVEWAIRYDMNGLAKLQLNELIGKHPQSPKLQLLARRIEGNELMKQQQAIAATMPANEVKKTAFVAPIPKVETKFDASKKQDSAKNMGHGISNPKNPAIAKKTSGSQTPPKTLPSIAISNPIASASPEITNKSLTASDPLTAQRKQRDKSLAPENSSDPFDPDVFNRMHAKGQKDNVLQEFVPPIETEKIFRR